MSAPRRLGRYLIERPLGAGGMGIVYLARSPTGRAVALKSLATGLDLELLARFKREARLLANLRHPGICSVIELVEQGPGAPFLVLEYVPGRTLSELAREDLPVDRVVELVGAVCDAVEHAHAAGVLHRDLKPGNVIVTDDGRVVVLDFGLARRIGDAESQALSRSGDVLGTPGFMAPEQIRGEALTTAADQYAIGAMLFACLTGEPPFHGKTILATLEAVLSKTPSPPSRLRADVPAALDAVCLRALQASPGGRYASVAELGAALRGWRSAGATPPRRAAVRAAVVLAVVGLAAAGIAAAVSRPGATEQASATPTAAAPTAAAPTAAPPTAAGAPTAAPGAPTAAPSAPGDLEARLRQWEKEARAFRRGRFPKAAFQRRAVAERFHERAAAALRWVDGTTRRRPGRAGSWIANGRIQLAFGRYETAVERARTALKLDPRRADAKLLLARAAWRRNLWAFLDRTLAISDKAGWAVEANALFDQLDGPAAPADAAFRATFELLIRRRQGELDDALYEAHRSAMARVPKDPEALALRALTERYIDKAPQRAIATLLQAAALAPRHPTVRRLLAGLRVEQGDRRSVADLRYVLTIHPTAHDMFVIANIYMDQARRQETEQVLAELPSPLRSGGPAALIRTRLAIEARRPAEAVQQLAVARSEPLPFVFRPFLALRAGQLALLRGDFTTCRRELLEASRTRGKHQHEAAYTLARYHHAQGDLDSALAAIDLHLRTHSSAEAHRVRGQILTDLQRHPQAIEALRAAVRIGRAHPRHRAWLGVAQAKAGRRAQARRTLSELARTHRGDVHTATLRAYLAIKLDQDGRRATAACRVAIARGGHEAWLAHLLRANLRARSGNMPGAIEDMSRSLELEPAQPFAAERRAELIQWRKGHPR